VEHEEERRKMGELLRVLISSCISELKKERQTEHHSDYT
jgi:hypothetical protein